MAHVEDRWMRKARGPDGNFLFTDKGKPVLERDPTRYGKGKRYRLRYNGPDGSETNEAFAKKTEADNRKTQVDAELLAGTWIDPDSGKVTFQRFAQDVVDNRTIDISTRELMRSRLVNHVYPHIGGREMLVLSKRPSMIQAVVKKLEAAGLSPGYIGTIMAHVGTVFAVAIDDEVVAKNPLKSKTIIIPDATDTKLVPWTVDQMHGIREALPRRFQATVDVGVGLGLRQGEILALSPRDIDPATGEVTVQRQIKVLWGKLFFAPPKGNKNRGLPLPESVRRALAEHAEEFPPVTVTLPWREPDGKPHTAKLYFAIPGNAHGGAIHKDRLMFHWHRALEAADIVPPFPERMLIAAGATRDEARTILELIEAESSPRSLRVYVARMTDAHMAAAMTRVRSGEQVAGLSVHSDLPPDPLPQARRESRGADYREHGMHMLRHLFASLLLTEGESPKAVAEWMGHADGGMLLLKTYAHLLPRSEQRMRTLVDRVLERPADQDHGPQTAQALGAV